MKEKRSKRLGMMLMFLSIIFVSLLLNSTMTSITVYLLAKAGILSLSNEAVPYAKMLILLNIMVSVPMGILISFVAVKFPLKPVRRLIDSMEALAAGDFKTRIDVGPIMKRNPAFLAVARSFNKMAQELESTELLRSDFINNFSHEFKTPIVSIAGFAKLLRRGNLSEEEKGQYLCAIEEESMRLSSMATNVLSLTKVENQAILTNVTCFNLSEQIRSCILLLEEKWEKKNLDIQLEFDEYQIRANEEMLKQVWINLLDNAVKFAPEDHAVQVRISDTESKIIVSVVNTGSEIPVDQQKRIFQKFYQADESHSSQGNGIGLAVVKRIVSLHSGDIEVSSGNNVTIFTVYLPKEA